MVILVNTAAKSRPSSKMIKLLSKNSHKVIRQVKRIPQPEAEVTACQIRSLKMTSFPQVLKSILSSLLLLELYLKREKIKKCVELSCIDIGNLLGTKPDGHSNIRMSPVLVCGSNIVSVPKSATYFVKVSENTDKKN